MSTMVNLGIGSVSIQEPLTRPGVKRDKKVSICSSTPQHRGYTNSSLLEVDVKVRKCHAMLFLRAPACKNQTNSKFRGKGGKFDFFHILMLLRLGYN